jgi:phospholipid/cholesterol/gamma-HCH transport system substrate-binding protein
MDERRYQFSVGLFVLAGMGVAVWLTFQFGKLPTYWEKHFQVVAHFHSAPGLKIGIPVRLSGIKLGSVSDVRIDREQGGVLVRLDIHEDYQLPKDSVWQIHRTILGDASIDVLPGSAQDLLKHGDLVEGNAPDDPMEVVRRLEHTVSQTLTSFTKTSKVWENVGLDVNRVINDKEHDLDMVILKAAETFEQLTKALKTAEATMQGAQTLVADPVIQKNLKEAVAAIPRLIKETEQTLIVAQAAVSSVQKSMQNLELASQPLVTYSKPILQKVDANLNDLHGILSDVKVASKILASEDGTFQAFAKNPDLYRNLNRSAALLSVLLQNLDPVIKDVRIFSDKVARHPELLGVSGAFKGSTGIKEDEVQPAGYQAPAQAPGKAALK